MITGCASRIKTVVTSTFSAEYIAASHTKEHIAWLRNLVHELLTSRMAPTVLQIDNQGAIVIIRATALTRKSKYIDIRYQHIEDCTRQDIIRPQ